MRFETLFLQIFEPKEETYPKGAVETREGPGDLRSEEQVSVGEPDELRPEICQKALKDREIRFNEIGS